MALDEVLLHEPTDVPLLRFYRWARPTVSFGYFGPADAARRAAGSREIVRRLTGGGIVEHGDDLTYTLVVPRTHEFTRLRSTESYRAIHAAVALALSRCGLEPQTHGGTTPKFPDDGRVNACFERPVLHDLMADGRKVAGGAQRRTRTGLLHQGSIRYDSDPSRLRGDDLHRELPLVLSHHFGVATITSDHLVRAGALATARYAASAWTDRVLFNRF